MKSLARHIVVATVVCGTFFASSCATTGAAGAGTAAQTTEKSAPSAVYSCPMDPDVASSEPGKCPKCGMDLEKQPPQ